MGTLFFEARREDDSAMKAVVSETGRVTIPKAIRDRLGGVSSLVASELSAFRHVAGEAARLDSGPCSSTSIRVWASALP